MTEPNTQTGIIDGVVTKHSEPDNRRGKSPPPKRSELALAAVPEMGVAARAVTSAGRPYGRPAPVPVVLELSQEQVDNVVRASSGGGALAVLTDGADALKERFSGGRELPSRLDDRRLSRSLLLGLLVYSVLPIDRTFTVSEVAKRIGLSPSTAHPYISTLLAVGVIEREATTRRYRAATEGQYVGA